MYDITATIYMTTYAVHMKTHPLFMTSQLFIYDMKSTISDLTSTVSVSSHPHYQWYHSHSKYDITSSIHVTSYPLYLRHHIHYMASQQGVLMAPHSAYVWHHLHYRWHHIISITPNYSIYDITSTSGMTSHPLYQTSHPVYQFHHKLSTDITPTFIWHHTHYMCDIIFTLYNITSTPYIITLLTYDIKTSIYETTSSM